jgi:hypothetical protein
MALTTTRFNGTVLALLYAALFCLTHITATILLGVFLRFVLLKFGVLGFPGAHLIVIVVVASFVALTFARRRHRLFTPTEFWVLLGVSALYLILLDQLLAASYVSAVGLGSYMILMSALLIVVDLAVLYLSLGLFGRRLMARYLVPPSNGA